MTGLLQSPSFRFSVGSMQYKERGFLKTKYIKLYTTGLFAKVLLTILFLLSPCLVRAGFVHPGLLHNQAELDFIKQKVQAEEQPWFNGWKKLLEADVSGLDWKLKLGGKLKGSGG